MRPRTITVIISHAVVAGASDNRSPVTSIDMPACELYAIHEFSQISSQHRGGARSPRYLPRLRGRQALDPYSLVRRSGHRTWLMSVKCPSLDPVRSPSALTTSRPACTSPSARPTRIGLRSAGR